jgi:hypothetical protein
MGNLSANGPHGKPVSEDLKSPENLPPQEKIDRAGPGKPEMTLKQAILLWFLFFLICLGLGYPTLNRYDPRKLPYAALDAMTYYDVVAGNPPPPPVYDQAHRLDTKQLSAENYYRLLVPYVAKPFYWLAKGHAGTWDPVFLGLLAANSLFTAVTACFLVNVGYRATANYTTALLGATLYLLNFAVANLNLAGLIDPGEACFLMVVVWTLLTDRWPLLPFWGVLGALAKETFAPLAGVFAFGWWLAEARRGARPLTRLAWVFAMGVTSLATVTVAMSSVSGGLIWPWQFAAYMRGETLPSFGYLVAFLRCVTDRTFWYVFVWLLPLGLLRLRRLPRPWVVAAALAFGAALVLGAYNDARGNTTRALFNVAGPILSLSVAVLLTEPKRLPGVGAGLQFRKR